MKVCFIGVGSIGKRHISNLVQICKEQKQNCEIHVLRSSQKELPLEVTKNIAKEFFNEKELDDWYDLIFITNPTFLHYKTLLKMKDKSNAFFIEKPVFDSNNYVIKAFSSLEKKYYVACPLRYTKVLQRAKEILAEQKICSVRAISSSFLPEWRKNVDYRKTYSAHKSEGGGVRIDLIHEWDYLTFLFGFPQKINCMYGKYSNLEIDSEDIAIYIASYKDKLVELHLDYFGRVTRRDLEVRTDEHEFIFDIANSKILCDGKEIENYQEEGNEKYLAEMRYFLNIVFHGFQNTNDLQEAMKVLKIVSEGN